jgi:hypothetical protein
MALLPVELDYATGLNGTLQLQLPFRKTAAATTQWAGALSG